MTNTPGRRPKANSLLPTVDPALDQDKIDQAAIAMRDQARDDEAAAFDVGQAVGAIQSTRMWRSAFRAAELKLFARLRALPNETVRKIPVRVDGEIRHGGTAREFCTMLFGASYSKLAEEQQNVEALGEEAYDAANRLGLNRSALRIVRALPPEKLEAVRSAIEAGSARADVLSVIEDLAEQVEQVGKERDEAQAEKQASDALLEKKNKRIDQLERDRQRISKLPLDEAFAALMKEAAGIAADCEGAVLGQLRQALFAIKNHGDQDNTPAMAGLVGQIQARLTALREEFGLPDTSSAAELELLRGVQQWGQD